MSEQSKTTTTTGAIADAGRDIPGLQSQLPGGVGTKFHADGTVRHFPGNTMVCHVQPGPLFDALGGLLDSLATLDFARSFTLLPPSSWHMTMFEGLCDQARTPGLWSSHLALDTPIDVTTAFLESRLADFALDCPPPYRLRVTGLQPIEVGFALKLEPIDDAENQRLRRLRDRLSELTGIRHANHLDYGFHIGLAYLIRHLTSSETQAVIALVEDWAAGAPLVELKAPEFCVFDSMFHFERQFYLGEANA